MSDDQLTLDDLSNDNEHDTTTKMSEVPRAAHIEHVAFGDLPHDWSWERSEDHLEYIRSGISTSQNKDGNGIPVSRIETIANGAVNYEKVGYISDDQDHEEDRLRAGDLLFSNINSRDEIGKTAIYLGEKPLYHGMNLLRLRYNSESFNPFFAYYVYDSPMAQDVFFRMSKAAVGQSSINQSQMEKFYLPQPSLEEQRKIASVLYTVDQAIQKTEEIIDRLERVLVGTRRDLMREGIGESRLVNTDSRFGKIPEHWEIKRLRDVADVVSGSTPSTNEPEYWDGTIPWATPTDLTELEGIVIKGTNDYITEEGLDSASTYLLPPESVLMTSRATIGKCAVNDVEMATNQGFQNLVPGDDLDTWYLYYRMTEEASYLESVGSGSTFSEVSNTTVQKIQIPVPPLNEQQKIAERLKSIDNLRHAERDFHRQLQRLKQGLMQDLLSGEVRTYDKDIDIVDDVLQYG